jgi:hypothetical protein
MFDSSSLLGIIFQFFLGCCSKEQQKKIGRQIGKANQRLNFF